jgi:RNA polymerase sigma-70 factor (ECF subfamily)
MPQTGDYLIVSTQDQLYREAAETFGAAIERLARGYEADPDKRRDLLQEIHLALWLSLGKFEGRCSLRTWVYRVAHNTSATHVVRQMRAQSTKLLSLEEIEATAGSSDHSKNADERLAVGHLLRLIQQLKPLEREVMLLYLEDLDAASISEITGISPGHVRVLVHRIKALLARRFQRGEQP